MSMDWANERYVRVYTRDTPDWLGLSFLAQGLFCLLLRKVSRAGILELGRAGRKGVFVAIGHAHEAAKLSDALDELLADGCIQINGDTLVVPNFLEAQDTPASDAQRAREHRARVRDSVTRPKRSVTGPSRDPEPRDGPVTERDAPVTECNKNVTPNCAVPSVPSVPLLQSAEPDPFPLSAEFLPKLEQRMCRTAPLPQGGGREVLEQVEAALKRLPMADAVECVWQRDVDGCRTGSRVKTLKLAAVVLADEVSRRATGPPAPKRYVAGPNGQPVLAEAKT